MGWNISLLDLGLRVGAWALFLNRCSNKDSQQIYKFVRTRNKIRQNDRDWFIFFATFCNLFCLRDRYNNFSGTVLIREIDKEQYYVPKINLKDIFIFVVLILIHVRGEEEPIPK